MSSKDVFQDGQVTASRNGVTVTVTVEHGKCYVQLSGKVTPALRHKADQMQYSIFPAKWVARQILMEA